jgi:hypothetical protein
MTRRLKPISIDKAFSDRALFGAALGDLSSWSSWRAVLKGAFAEPLTPDEAATFAEVAGGRAPPGKPVRELWSIVGRRGGKSKMAALVGAYIAAFADRTKIKHGDEGVVLILSQTQRQARVVFGYLCGYFEASPLLKTLVTAVKADELHLQGRVVIRVQSASFRSVRGPNYLAAVFDECGFWRDSDSRNPDAEIYNAVVPGLGTTRGVLVGISTPYGRTGLLYEKYQKSYGKADPDVLVIQSDTLRFNPTFDERTVENAHLADAEMASAEYGAMFRGDLTSYVSRDVLEACVDDDFEERPFDLRHRYMAFVDLSGGMHDSMTLCVAHREGERVVLDLAQEWRAPFSPPDVVEEMIPHLRKYKCQSVNGDNYAGGWGPGAFQKHGIRYVVEKRDRSELYLRLLPLLSSQLAVLPNNQRLIGQLAALNRRTGRSGRDAIDHTGGKFDDLAVACAGALVKASETSGVDWRERRSGANAQTSANIGGRVLITGGDRKDSNMVYVGDRAYQKYAITR